MKKYARRSELNAGMKVEVGAGFSCIPAGDIRTVYAMPGGAGALYIDCASGHHTLDGQLAGDNDSLIGIYPVESN